MANSRSTFKASRNPAVGGGLSLCVALVGVVACKQGAPPEPPPYAVPPGVNLPVSAASTPPKPGRQLVVIARDAVFVGGRRVVTLERGVWPTVAETAALRQALRDAPTTIVADADTPFRTFTRVLAANRSGDLELVVRNGGVGGAEMAVPIEPSPPPSLTPPEGPTIALRPNGYTVVIGGKPLEVEDESELIRQVAQEWGPRPDQLAQINAVDDKPLQEVVRLLDLLRPICPRVRFFVPAR